MPNSLVDDTKLIVCSPSAVAAQTDLDGAVIDMTANGGYDAVMFVALLGDVSPGCVLELTCRSSPNANGSSSAQDTTTGTLTAGASDCDNKLMVLDVSIPAGPYVFSRLKRGTANAVVSGVLAILYRGWKKPSVQSADVVKQLYAIVR